MAQAEGLTPKHLIIYQTDFKKYKMKKILFILFTLIIADSVISQGNNLQFNQVLNYTYNGAGSNTNFQNVGSITVGSNKVMKITSGSAYYLQNNYPSNYNMIIKVGEHIVMTNRNQYENNTPICLSTGTYTVYLQCAYNSATSIHGSLSIVEFNLVQ